MDLIVDNISPLVRAFAKIPHVRLELRALSDLLSAEFLTLFPAVALILFLAALHREQAGNITFQLRQRFAMVAVIGQATGLLFLLIATRNFLPYHPAQYWSEFIALRVVPFLCWIALLRIFWKDAAPLSRRATRFLAGLLCAFVLLRGLRGSYTMVVRLSRSAASNGWNLWDYGVTPVIRTLSWASLALFLFALYRETSSRRGAGESAIRP